MEDFLGYHSEWNLGSPGGWDYQRITQKIAKASWQTLNQMHPVGVDLDFDHPLLCPVKGFTRMVLDEHRRRQGGQPGAIAVVAEEETLEDVTENINFARRLDQADGVTGILSAPHEFEVASGKVCHQGRPISLIFMDFNNDVFLKLHRKHDLSPLIQAISEGRVLNPRGTEPINVKSMFEVLTTDAYSHRFQPETVRRTPWTRRFFERATNGPQQEKIADLVAWTRDNWPRLVLKPERGYSGIGVKVGEVHTNADDAIETALKAGRYIVQERVSLPLWAEDMPEIDHGEKKTALVRRQTDFRCLLGPDTVFGFLARYGDVPTNVGSGGGVQPIAVLRSDMPVRDAVDRLNRALVGLSYDNICELENRQKEMAVAERFTYLLGPIKIALRPRVVTTGQLAALKAYCTAMWTDSLTLEKMWQAGELDEYIDIEEEELAIARLQPWKGSPAIFAADGLFSFGAHPEDPGSRVAEGLQ
ncbi:MAG: hypothetical protein P8X96_01805 [Desulfobacteraceae bacterium]